MGDFFVTPATPIGAISSFRQSKRAWRRNFGCAKTVVLFAAMLVTSTSMPAAAGTITWTLENVTLSDGTPSDNASLVGSFATDATTLQLTAYDIDVVGGPYGTGSGYDFSNLIANFVLYNGPVDYGVSNYGDGFIVWDFVSPLAADVSTDNISFAEFYCQACNGYTITGTSGEAIQTPEPITLSLFGTGLAGVVAIRRRKKKSAQRFLLSGSVRK